MTAIRNLLAWLLVLGAGSTPAFGGGLDQVVLLATDPVERKAVLKIAGGKLKVLGPGEKIEGTDSVLERVLADKVVARETLDELPRRRRAWIYLPDRPAGVPRVRYFEPSSRTPVVARPLPPSAQDSDVQSGGESS